MIERLNQPVSRNRIGQRHVGDGFAELQGKLNGDFVAYNAATGEALWSHDVRSGAASGPGTFAIDGEQYVTITICFCPFFII